MAFYQVHYRTKEYGDCECGDTSVLTKEEVRREISSIKKYKYVLDRILKCEDVTDEFLRK